MSILFYMFYIYVMGIVCGYFIAKLIALKNEEDK